MLISRRLEVRWAPTVGVQWSLDSSVVRPPADLGGVNWTLDVGITVPPRASNGQSSGLVSVPVVTLGLRARCGITESLIAKVAIVVDSRDDLAGWLSCRLSARILWDVTDGLMADDVASVRVSDGDLNTCRILRGWHSWVATSGGRLNSVAYNSGVDDMAGVSINDWDHCTGGLLSRRRSWCGSRSWLLRDVTDNSGVDDLASVSINDWDNFTGGLRLLCGWFGWMASSDGLLRDVTDGLSADDMAGVWVSDWDLNTDRIRLKSGLDCMAILR